MWNYYLIFFFPGVWSYELFELYMPGSSWNPSTQMKASTDYENYFGRKKYASNTAGGYYAARLPILKYLSKIKNPDSSKISLRPQKRYEPAYKKRQSKLLDCQSFSYIFGGLFHDYLLYHNLTPCQLDYSQFNHLSSFSQQTCWWHFLAHISISFLSEDKSRHEL